MLKIAVRSAFTSLLLLGGCATQVGFQTFQQREAALAGFEAGQAQLSCMTGQCLAAWNATRPVVAQAASARSWDDVAADVLAANFDQDLGWYYLGSAASALGYHAVARTYFERAIQASMAGGLQACATTGCDGWNLPGDARIALAGLAPMPGRVAARRRPVAPRRVAPASASSSWVSPTTSASAPASSPGWVAPVSGGSSSASSGGPAWVAPVPSNQ